MLEFRKAFYYPFNRAKGLLNILWFFLPIFGWFALGGYGVRIVQEFSKGKFKQLPVMDFFNDLKLGFMMFLKALPFMILYIILVMGIDRIDIWFSLGVRILLGFFVVPILTINFLNKQTVGAYFEFGILKSVFSNLGDYLMVVLKSIALAVIFLIMWIVLVGIPAGTFTQYIFLADFYKRRVKF